MAKIKQKKEVAPKKEAQRLHKMLGFISEYDGREIPFDEYIKLANKGEEPGSLPIPVLEGIKNLLLDQEDVNGIIRVTSMLGCVRQIYFEKKIGKPQYVKPFSIYPMFRGTIAHKIMEGFTVKGAIDEQRFIREYKGFKITGKPDRIIPSERKIQDYKSTETLPEFGRVYKSHEEQLNIYRWLIGEEYQTDELEVIYISMKGAKSLKARIWSDLELETFLSERISLIEKALNKDELVPFEKIWLCDYCDYRNECKEHALNGFLDEIAKKVKEGETIEKGKIAKKLHNLTIL